MIFSHLISKANNHLSIWAEKAVLKRHSLCLLQQEMRTIICFFLLAFHGSAINRGTFNQIENIVTTFVDWCNTNYHIYTPQKTNIRVIYWVMISKGYHLHKLQYATINKNTISVFTPVYKITEWTGRRPVMHLSWYGLCMYNYQRPILFDWSEIINVIQWV